MKNEKEFKSIIGVYLDTHLKKILVNIAKQNRRSLSAQIALILEEYLAAKGK